jgi:hypothetical protein
LPGITYIGVISYGLYLWHWPLFLLLNHQRTGLSGGALLALRLGVTFAVAVVSYHLLELPIRRGKLRLPHPRLLAPVGIAALVAVLVAATPPAAAIPGDVTNPNLAAPRPQARIGSKLPPDAAVGTSRVLIVGDSVALTLGNALSLNEQPYHVHLDNAGVLGCGIARGGLRRFDGQVEPPPSYCATWPQDRAKQVAFDRPDLVALLVGRWEIVDQVHDGQWVHVGEPAFDAYLASELDRAIDVLSSTGARVALLTYPCSLAPEAPDGTPYPEGDPTRLATFNQLLADAARRHPKQSVLVDFNAMVCPGGKFTSRLDGVTIRGSDGLHFPLAPLPPVAKRLLPVLRQLAAEAKIRH